MSTGAERLTLLRSLHLPDYLTLANATCGALAVFAALAHAATDAPGPLLGGAALVALAAVFDLADGRVARRLGRSSRMGRELDSLADAISFGVAPAALGYAAGLRAPAAVAALVFFVAGAVCRLARYNVTADRLAGPGGKVTHFEGTPVTFGILPMALAVAAGAHGLLGPGLVPAAAGLYALVGCTMASKTLRVPKP